MPQRPLRSAPACPRRGGRPPRRLAGVLAALLTGAVLVAGAAPASADPVNPSALNSEGVTLGTLWMNHVSKGSL